jgi:hypothetical protein
MSSPHPVSLARRVVAKIQLAVPHPLHKVVKELIETEDFESV